MLGFTLAEIRPSPSGTQINCTTNIRNRILQRLCQNTIADIGWHLCKSTQKVSTSKEAKKLAEEFKKEQVASQWAGIPHEKLLQESFVEQLNSLQSLDQLAPLKAAKEHLPKDIINILELLGKADNIPFNQLYNLVEDCVDRYYTKVI